jgi:DNA-binding CsgD family transcriptional regulator
MFSVLEHAEIGVLVIDRAGRALYMNASARELLSSPLGTLPSWTTPHLGPLLDKLDQVTHAVERWTQDDLVLRVRARPHDGLAVLEMSGVRTPTGTRVADQLSRSLRLTISDARLLALLWRGMSNEEIAHTLGVRVGTIKSRLFRLYQKLGVKRRPAAVLRAAEVLAA